MNKKEFEADSILSNIELATKKAQVAISDLENTYFSMLNPKGYVLQEYYEDAGVRNTIVNDYLCTIDEKLKELRQLLCSEEELKVEEKEPEISLNTIPGYKRGTLLLLKRLWKLDDFKLWSNIYLIIKALAKRRGL